MNFPEFENELMGGHQNFKFCPISDVQSMPYIYNKVASSLPTMVTGKSLLIGRALPDTLYMEVEHAAIQAGNQHSVKISGQVLWTDEYLALFSSMRGNRYMVIINDNNNRERIVGSNKTGCEFSFTETSGQTPAQPNVIKYEFKGVFTESPPLYSA